MELGNPICSFPRPIGITVLYEGTGPTVDIICVHGLNSTPGRCWKTGDVLWLKDLLPKVLGLENTRIATFGYNSNILQDASTARIKDHARNLLQDLSDERKDKEAQTRPIIFVCHSLGGIVVKQALVMANSSQADGPNRFEAIKKSTYGIMFLGTPHKGSESASLGRIVARIAGVAFQDPKIQLLKSLKENSKELQDLSVEFSKLHSLFQIVSFYEQKETVFGKMIFAKSKLVVPESSATLAIEGEILVAMNTDHHNICKFSNVNDPGYMRVSNRIAELVRNSQSASGRLIPQYQLLPIRETQPEVSDPANEEAGVVDVALGTVYSLYQSCSAQFGNIRNYTKYLKKNQEVFLAQEGHFAHVCQSILHALVEKGVAAAMLEDRDHFQWKDPIFLEEWDAIRGSFNTPLRICRETLEDIENKLSALYTNLTANGKNPPASTNSLLPDMGGTKATGLLTTKELQQLIQTLKIENQDLRYLREKLHASGEFGSRRRERYPKPSNPKAVLRQLLGIREVAKRVYDGLAVTAQCPCHHVNLQLQSQLDETDLEPGASHTDVDSESLLGSSPTIKFRFIVTKVPGGRGLGLDSEIQCECTCITINSELQPSSSENIRKSMKRSCPTYIGSENKKVRFAAENNENHFETSSARAIITISDSGEVGEKRVMSIDIGPGRKRVKFEVEGEKDKGERFISAATGNKPKTVVYDIKPLTSMGKINAAEIDNLCSHLARLQSGKETKELLGRIPHQGCSPTYQHLIYRDPSTSGPTSRISLEGILARPDKQCLLPRLERLKIAYVLSLSLLHFGSYSTSWFQERWRSRNIFFFMELQNQLQKYGTTLGPYVVPCFPKSDRGMPPPPTPSSYSGIARNEQLFSLALVLIEIAFSDMLFKIYEPAKIPTTEGDDIAEFMKAKMILDSGMLTREMGLVYSQVVSRCLYCDFGIDGADFSKRELQEIFYEKVVCELENDLKSFKSSLHWVM